MSFDYDCDECGDNLFKPVRVYKKSYDEVLQRPSNIGVFKKVKNEVIIGLCKKCTGENVIDKKTLSKDRIKEIEKNYGITIIRRKNGYEKVEDLRAG